MYTGVYTETSDQAVEAEGTMASNLHRLTALWVAKCRKEGLHADGSCLYLKVAPRYAPKPKQGKPRKLTGVTKSWVFRYGQRGKHVMGCLTSAPLGHIEVIA